MTEHISHQFDSKNNKEEISIEELLGISGKLYYEDSNDVTNSELGHGNEALRKL